MTSENIKIVQATTIPITLLTFAKGQLAYLKQNGFELLALSSPGGDLEAVGQREGVDTHGILMHRDIRPVQDIMALSRIWWFFRQSRPSIVHGGTPKAAMLSLFAAFLLRIPVRIFCIHGLRSEGLTGWKKTVVKAIEAFCCRCANRVLCVSESVRDLAIKEGICDPDKLKVLHNGTANGVDVSYFDPGKYSDADKVAVYEKLNLPAHSTPLLFVGRVVRDKGIAVLYEAWIHLKSAYPDVYLLVAGDEEPTDPATSKIIASLKQDRRVKMLGHVEDIAPLYAIASLLVLPSYREGFGMVLAEANAMGLPVVATRVTGCMDAVIDGVTGTLVPPGNPRALAHAVSCYLDNKKLSRKHGNAGRERVVRDFQPIDIWRSLHKEYISLLKKQGVAVQTTADKYNVCEADI